MCGARAGGSYSGIRAMRKFIIEGADRIMPGIQIKYSSYNYCLRIIEKPMECGWEERMFELARKHSSGQRVVYVIFMDIRM